MVSNENLSKECLWKVFYHTLIRMWDELCPPSDESRFPGNPADSQFEQISTESHIAQ